MNDPFKQVPTWAERELSKAPAADVAELEMLRTFYDAWEDMHSIPNDKLHRNKKEAAAERLVGAAHTIRAFRQPSQMAKLLHG